MLWLGGHIACLGWYESPLDMFVGDRFIWVVCGHFLEVHGEPHLDQLPHCVFCGALLSLGVDVRALPFIPWSAGVCEFSTSKVIGTYFVQTEPHIIQFEGP